jgi:hypothetical protein
MGIFHFSLKSKNSGENPLKNPDRRKETLKSGNIPGLEKSDLGRDIPSSRLRFFLIFL